MPCAEPAVHLSVHEHRVQDPAAVVDGDVAHQPHVAGLRVDLDDRDVRAERERRLQLAERPGRREAGLHPLRQARRVVARPPRAPPT